MEIQERQANFCVHPGLGGGVNCRACPKTVSTALEDVDGVYNVDATYEPPEAVVRFDPAATSVDRLTTATENVGFSAHPQSDS